VRLRAPPSHHFLDPLPEVRLSVAPASRPSLRTDAAAPAAGGGVLRLIGTTDLHMQILAHDYVTDRPAPRLGLARAAAAIARLRAGADAALLLDAGDFLQGNALGDLALAETTTSGRIHPMIAAMNAAGFDAVTLGNHDLDHGLGALWAMLSGARFATVSANLRPLEGGAWPCRPWTILTREIAGRALRIGVTGALPPRTMRWNHHQLAERVEIGAIRPALADAAARMRAAGADVVVALCHAGVGAAGDETEERIAARIAALAGIDAVFAGHTHEVVAHAGGPGAPLVQAGALGSHLGCIDLTLEPEGAAGWRVRGAEARAICLRAPLARADLGRVAKGAAKDGAAKDGTVKDGTVKDGAGRDGAGREGAGAAGAGPAAARPVGQGARIRALVAGAHARARAAGNVPIGRTEGRIHSHLAALSPPPTVRLIAALQAEAVAAALAGGPHGGLAILSAAAPLRAGDARGAGPVTDIAPGTVLRRHLDDICPHADRIAARLIDGAGLEAWLAQAARVFAAAPSDDPGAAEAPPLLRDDRPLHGFDTIEGLSYRIALDPVPHVRDLRHEGRPVGPRDRFVLAASSFRLHGGGGYPPPPPGTIVLEGAQALRGALERHLAGGGSPRIGPDAAPCWRLEATPGTRRSLIVPVAARELVPRGTACRAGPEPGTIRLTVAF